MGDRVLHINLLPQQLTSYNTAIKFWQKKARLEHVTMTSLFIARLETMLEEDFFGSITKVDGKPLTLMLLDFRPSRDSKLAKTKLTIKLGKTSSEEATNMALRPREHDVLNEIRHEIANKLEPDNKPAPDKEELLICCPCLMLAERTCTWKAPRGLLKAHMLQLI